MEKKYCATLEEFKTAVAGYGPGVVHLLVSSESQGAAVRAQRLIEVKRTTAHGRNQPSPIRSPSPPH